MNPYESLRIGTEFTFPGNYYMVWKVELKAGMKVVNQYIRNSSGEILESTLSLSDSLNWNTNFIILNLGIINFKGPRSGGTLCG
jgi:hypothetical protein